MVGVLASIHVCVESSQPQHAQLCMLAAPVVYKVVYIGSQLVPLVLKIPC